MEKNLNRFNRSNKLNLLLRLSIGFLWVFTGVVCAFFIPLNHSEKFLKIVGVSSNYQAYALYGSCALDIILGLATWFNYKLRLVVIIQSILIIGYTLIVSIKLPNLWLDPFGSISKNIPLLFATWAMLALENKKYKKAN